MSASRCLYYPNSCASCQLLLQGGDISTNPGPDQSSRAKKPASSTPCPECNKRVQTNHKRFMCTKCFDLYHAKCTNISVVQLKKIKGDTPKDWICTQCLHTELPFNRCDEQDISVDSRPSVDEIDGNPSSVGSTDEHHEQLSSRPNQLNILHLNTQSMLSTFDELLVTIKEYSFDVIAMSETWLKNNPHLLNYVTIPGYSILYRNRDNIRGGGVGIYIKESLNFKRRADVEEIEPELEHIWLEINGRNKHSKLLLGVMYRSNRMQAYQTWLGKTENLISQLNINWDGLLMITGDFNIDLLKPEEPMVKQYTDMLDSFNLHQLVKIPTRVTSKSKTLIDHIITNMPNRITYTSVLPCPTISDHDAPYACVNIRVTRFQPRFKMIRDEKHFDNKAFIDDFSTLPFSVIYSTDDPDDKLYLFNSLFKSCLDRHAPLRKTKLTRPPAPWLNSEDIRQLQTERNKLRYLAHKTQSDVVWQAFRDIRNRIKTTVKKLKRSFYQKALSSKKPKDLWKIIHRILHPNPKPLNMDPNILNDHFSSTTQRLLGTTPTSHDSLEEMIASLPYCRSDAFSLRKVTHREVLQLLKSMRSDSSTGPDQIPVKFIKLVADIIASPITHILNEQILRNSFPTAWKTARVSPHC